MQSFPCGSGHGHQLWGQMCWQRGQLLCPMCLVGLWAGGEVCVSLTWQGWGSMPNPSPCFPQGSGPADLNELIQPSPPPFPPSSSLIVCVSDISQRHSSHPAPTHLIPLLPSASSLGDCFIKIGSGLLAFGGALLSLNVQKNVLSKLDLCW